MASGFGDSKGPADLVVLSPWAFAVGCSGDGASPSHVWPPRLRGVYETLLSPAAERGLRSAFSPAARTERVLACEQHPTPCPAHDKGLINIVGCLLLDEQKK